MGEKRKGGKNEEERVSFFVQVFCSKKLSEKKRKRNKFQKKKKSTLTLGARHQLLAVVLLELLDAVLVDGVDLSLV